MALDVQKYSNWGWTGSTYAERIYFRVNYVSTDALNNRTRYRLRIWNNSNNSHGDTGTINIEVKRGNTVIRTKTLSNQKTTGNNQTITYDDYYFYVNHSANGSLGDQTFALSITRTAGNVKTATVAVKLTDIPTIPRESTITTYNNFTIGNNIPWAVDKKHTTYVHRVELIVAGVVIITQDTSSASGTLGITEALRDQILGLTPKATNVIATLRVRTYTNSNYTTQVGATQTDTANASVASTVIPSFTSISHSEYVNLVNTEIGEYVQNKSRILIELVNAVAGTGSTIKSFRIEVDGQVATVQSGPTEVISRSGVLTIRGMVVDERNRSYSDEVSVNVLPYQEPTLEAIGLMRSASNGDQDPFGTHARLAIKSKVSDLNGKNSATYRVRSKAWPSGAWSTKTSPTPIGISDIKTHIYSGYAVTSEYQFEVVITDKLGSQTIVNDLLFLSTGGVPLFVGYDGIATSFGKIPTYGTTYDAEFGFKGFRNDGPSIDKNGYEMMGNAQEIMDGASESGLPSYYNDNFLGKVVVERRSIASLGLTGVATGTQAIVTTYVTLNPNYSLDDRHKQVVIDNSGSMFTRTAGSAQGWTAFTKIGG